MSVAFSGLSSFDALSPLEDYSTLWFILISNSGLRSAGSSLHHISHGVRYWCRCRQRGPKFGVMFAHDYLFSGKKWGKNSGERGVEKLSDSLFAFFCWVTPYLLLLLLLLFPSFRSLSATGTDYYFPIKSKRAIYIFQRNSKPLSVSVSLKIKTP